MDQLRIISNYLAVSETEYEELLNRADMKVPGSCQWLLEKQAFIDWRDASSMNARDESSWPPYGRSPSSRSHHKSQTPRVFWLIGPPGSGKSFLATHVIQHLSRDRECSFYFLKHGDRLKQNISALLKSLAFQMARRHVGLRRWLLSLTQENILTAEANDFRTIWKQLFPQKIFQNDLQQRQYWVIDAIDEARGGHELIALLAQIPSSLPYSIFLTSRRDMRLEKLMRFHKIVVTIEHIDMRNSLQDIRAYLEAYADDLPVSDPADVQELISRLVQKSRGSFLWTHLVMQQLSDFWTKKDIEIIMKNVPEGMHELYYSILDDMSENRRKNLSKSILCWTICAIRPLTVDQFQEAVQLDLQDEVPKIEDAIAHTCGQLISVEQGQVQLVHDTVREFLLDKDLQNEFAVNKTATHGRIAATCLEHLTKGARGPRSRRPLQYRISSDVAQATFYDYASTFFSEHVVKSTSEETDTPMSQLVSFLQTSVLSWIEYNARKADLSTLTSAGKNFKCYVGLRVNFQAPLTGEMSTVHGWAIDLIHLVTMFGRFLLHEPSAIHSVIPPLCPPKSMIFRSFGRLPQGLEIIGLSADDWSDRISSISFAPDYTTALACCEKFYAVGTRGGLIVVFHASTCQEAWRVNCNEPVRQLEFAQSSNWLIVSARSRMTMYNYDSQELIWQVGIVSEHLALTILEDLNGSKIVAATKTNQLVTYDPATGMPENFDTWERQERTTGQRPPPQRVYICSELNLLALVYRNRPLKLLDLGDLSRPRYADYRSSVEALTFNAAQDMLAMASFDGELCTLGLWNLQKIKSISLTASHLAATTDGKTLIAGTNSGSIQILDFESLDLLHTIHFEEQEIVSIMFTGNGLRFLDIRRQLLNVWVPSALVRRKDGEDTTSEGQTSYSTAPSQLLQAYLATNKEPITAIVSHHSAEFVFCGKQSGTVTVYETISLGKQMQGLYEHVKSAVLFMDWNAAKNLLVSCDNASRIMIHQVKLVQDRSTVGLKSKWAVKKILDKRLDVPIRQVLFSVGAEYLLVSSTTTDHVWTLDGSAVLSHSCDQLGYSGTLSQKWTLHPRQKRRFIELESFGVHAIEWDKHKDIPPSLRDLTVDTVDETVMEVRGTHVHFLRFEDGTWAAYDNSPVTRPILWNPPSFSALASATMLNRFKATVPVIKYLVGLFQSQLVLLDSDGWIRTMRLDEAAAQSDGPTRRFPIPHHWQNNNSRQRPLALVTALGDVVIAAGDELVIVKRGLITNNF